jgi:hypothetical protein
MYGDYFEMFFNDLTFHTFYFSEKNYKWRYNWAEDKIKLYYGRNLYCTIQIVNESKIYLDKELSEYDDWFVEVFEKYFKKLLTN